MTYRFCDQVAVGAAAGAAAKGAANSTTAAGAGAANSTAAAANSTAAAGAGAANTTATANNPDIQNSLTLDPSVIAKGFEQNGQAVAEAGQVPSLTSSNNFINFCATTGQTITNGLQVKGGSCNPAPMGQIPATTAMPSSKFTNPTNMQNIAANTAFTITMAIQNMETGNFVNAESNYFSAPQQLNAQGQIIGHSHVVVEQLSAIDQTTPTDPTKFAFFKGLNSPAANGVLSADVTAGLPAGVYKLSSINTAANHQPALVPIAQHGSLDDAVYFTVGGAGAAGAAGAANSTAAAGAAGAANSTAAAGAAGATGATGATGAAAASSTAAAGGAAAAGGKGAAAKGGKGKRFIRETY